jgi:hypothetical protein
MFSEIRDLEKMVIIGQVRPPRELVRLDTLTITSGALSKD